MFENQLSQKLKTLKIGPTIYIKFKPAAIICEHKHPCIYACEKTKIGSLKVKLSASINRNYVLLALNFQNSKFMDIKDKFI